MAVRVNDYINNVCSNRTLNVVAAGSQMNFNFESNTLLFLSKVERTRPRLFAKHLNSSYTSVYAVKWGNNFRTKFILKQKIRLN